MDSIVGENEIYWKTLSLTKNQEFLKVRKLQKDEVRDGVKHYNTKILIHFLNLIIIIFISKKDFKNYQ